MEAITHSLFYKIYNIIRPCNVFCAKTHAKQEFFRKFNKFYEALNVIKVLQNVTMKEKNIKYGGTIDNRIVSM